MKFSELPGEIRVKLDDEGERELWHRIDEFGGVRQFSTAFDISESKLYNWRHKDVFYPVGFVRRLMGNNASGHVTAMKGGGRSRPLRNPEFPLPENDELLTRVEASVNVNREGVPVYRAKERSLVERFEELLSEVGEIPVSSYRRNGHELRYPKYMHSIFEKMEYKKNFAALVDEEGRIEEGKLVAGKEYLPVEEFEDELYSRQKRLELALELNNSEEVERLIGEETRKVRQIFGG